MESEEHKRCDAIFKARKETHHELKEMHPGTDDITSDWEKVLNDLFKLVEVLKVPGRKAKCKLQLQSSSECPSNDSHLTVDPVQHTTRTYSARWCSSDCRRTL